MAMILYVSLAQHSKVTFQDIVQVKSCVDSTSTLQGQKERTIENATKGPQAWDEAAAKGRNLLTGQVPPLMIRSNERASGIPIETPLPIESMVDPPMDLAFSSPVMEAREESTCGGRR